MKKNKRKLTQGYFIFRIFFCIFITGLTLLSYIEKQNELTELRLAIPLLTKEVKSLQEKNTQLAFEIGLLENPIHLMELMRKPEFKHLKYPFLPDEVFLPQADPLVIKMGEF